MSVRGSKGSASRRCAPDIHLSTMQPIVHSDPLYQDMDASRSTLPHVGSPFPLHWYIFFGIFEPITVLAGVVYAIYFQEK